MAGKRAHERAVDSEPQRDDGGGGEPPTETPDRGLTFRANHGGRVIRLLRFEKYLKRHNDSDDERWLLPIPSSAESGQGTGAYYRQTPFHTCIVYTGCTPADTKIHVPGVTAHPQSTKSRADAQGGRKTPCRL
ncbi:hypothetical protein HPB50_008136 [Hyalomma asiaticum]|uniref:Uncharacterized protein n=1 Tax=Hyalomma asiaticum TaxID=266040 RepID=A0ACB7SM72_HYAAI|nr:hypothetical protein HPB50_008136 [Hyalomma asiaticum]